MKISIILICSLVFFFSCDNTKQIKDSQKDSSFETENLKKNRSEYEKSLDSLNNEVKNISKSKSEIEKSLAYAEAEIYSILNNSYFDHIIIGSVNLTKSEAFLRDTLGFKIKTGKLHNNGILNAFIEFSDSSEIEMISVNNPNDKLAKYYASQIKKRNYGIGLAIRTKQIKKLSEQMNKLGLDFSEFSDNYSYSTLSKKNYDLVPYFFIEYHNSNLNQLVKHENWALGISHIWLATKQLKETLLEFIDYGFNIIDTLNLRYLKNKSILIGNKNFKIILMEGNENRVEGVSINVVNLDKLKESLDNFNLHYYKTLNKEGKRGIQLSPKVSRSIWFEFLEY